MLSRASVGPCIGLLLRSPTGPLPGPPWDLPGTPPGPPRDPPGTPPGPTRDPPGTPMAPPRDLPPIDPSTLRPIDPSTHRLIDPSTHRRIDPSAAAAGDHFLARLPDSVRRKGGGRTGLPGPHGEGGKLPEGRRSGDEEATQGQPRAPQTSPAN